MILAQNGGNTDTVTALLHLVFIVGMVAFLVGGTVALLVLWYVRGRDPAIDRVAEYITEPPDDLPPGAAGTLLDERADHQDVVATLLGLARHGAIQIHEIQPEPRSRRARVEYELEVVDPAATKSRLERDLLNALFAGAPEAGQRALLRDVKGRFDAQERYIKADLYQELVDRKYFTRSPEDTRAAWRRLSWFGLVGSIVLGVIVWQVTDAFALLPTVAAVLVWIAMLRMSKSMPQKTRHGAESAARWRAFRTYLQSIEKHEDLVEARALFDRYLSYAVAFGMEKRWMAGFAAAGVSSPGWFNSPSVGNGEGAGDVGGTILDTLQTAWIFGHIGGGGGGVDLPNVGMPNVDLPNVGMPNLGDADIQGMAEAMGGGLQDMSGGLAGLLDSAGGIFDSIDFDF